MISSNLVQILVLLKSIRLFKPCCNSSFVSKKVLSHFGSKAAAAGVATKDAETTEPISLSDESEVEVTQSYSD